jgi:membrane protease YdiL (CAAX protease family)
LDTCDNEARPVKPLEQEKKKNMKDLENKNYPNIGQSFGIAGIMILASILISPLTLIGNKFIDKDLLFLIYYVIAVGVTFFIVYSIRKRKTDNTTFNFKIENKRIIPFVIILIAALNFGLIAPIINLIPMPESLQKIFADLMGKYSFFTFITIVIAAPILEELIFRGIILDGLLKKHSPVKSILIASVLFGLVHLNPWQFIAALSLGAFAGWIYYETKSVSFAIIIHAANNLGGFLIGYFSNSDTLSTNKTLIESYGGVLNLVLVLVSSIAIVAISIYYLREEFKKNKKNDNSPTLQVHRFMKSVYFFIPIALLSTVIFFTVCKNQDEKVNNGMSLEDCFQKNIESATLMTGWYYVSETDSGFVRQMDKTDVYYKINPFPIVTVEDMTAFSIQENNDGSTYLLMKFGTRGTESWREATRKTIGKNLAFIVNDKLLYTPYVNMEIPNGNSALHRNDYSKEEFEKIEQAIKDNKK